MEGTSSGLPSYWVPVTLFCSTASLPMQQYGTLTMCLKTYLFVFSHFCEIIVSKVFIWWRVMLKANNTGLSAKQPGHIKKNIRLLTMTSTTVTSASLDIFAAHGFRVLTFLPDPGIWVLNSQSQSTLLSLHSTSVSSCQQEPAPSLAWLQQVAGSLLQHLLLPGCEWPPDKASCICPVAALAFGLRFSCNYPAKRTKPFVYNLSFYEIFKSLAALTSTVTSCSAFAAGTTRSRCWLNSPVQTQTISSTAAALIKKKKSQQK